MYRLATKCTTKNEASLRPNTRTQLQRFFLRLCVGTVPFGATADSEVCRVCRDCRADCSVRAEVCGLQICTRYDRLSQQQLSFLFLFLIHIREPCNDIYKLRQRLWLLIKCLLILVVYYSVKIFKKSHLYES